MVPNPNVYDDKSSTTRNNITLEVHSGFITSSDNFKSDSFTLPGNIYLDGGAPSITT